MVRRAPARSGQQARQPVRLRATSSLQVLAVPAHLRARGGTSSEVRSRIRRHLRRCHSRRVLPLQVRHRGLRLGLGLRGVVDDLALVRGDAVDRVEHDRRVVHRDALEHRTHSLAADLGPLVVVRRGADVERAAADELHRVGEVRQRQQTADGALRGVVDVVEVRQAVGRDVQDLLDVVAVIGENLGELGQLVDTWSISASLFSFEEALARRTAPGSACPRCCRGPSSCRPAPARPRRRGW